MQLTPQEKRMRVTKRTVLGLFAVAVVAFVGAKLYPLVHGPDIQLATMTNGAHLTEPMIRLSGKARFTKDLVVNGAPLATAPDGTFDEHFLLNPGYNVITMEGRDRFGHRSISNYAVILTEEPDHTLTLNTLPPKTN